MKKLPDKAQTGQRGARRLEHQVALELAPSNNNSALVKWVLCSLLAVAQSSYALSICARETSVSEHFETIELGYAKTDGEKLEFGVILSGISPQLSAQISVYYGIPDDVNTLEELGDRYQIKTELWAWQDDYSVEAEFSVDGRFARLLIEVRTASVKDGLPTCGYSHYLIVENADIPEDKAFGELGPMILEE